MLRMLLIVVLNLSLLLSSFGVMAQEQAEAAASANVTAVASEEKSIPERLASVTVSRKQLKEFTWGKTINQRLSSKQLSVVCVDRSLRPLAHGNADQCYAYGVFSFEKISGPGMADLYEGSNFAEYGQLYTRAQMQHVLQQAPYYIVFHKKGREILALLLIAILLPPLAIPLVLWAVLAGSSSDSYNRRAEATFNRLKRLQGSKQQITLDHRKFRIASGALFRSLRDVDFCESSDRECP